VTSSRSFILQLDKSLSLTFRQHISAVKQPSSGRNRTQSRYIERYIFTAIGFPLGDSGPYTLQKSPRTVIYIRTNNTDHRTHTIESKTYETIKQK